MTPSNLINYHTWKAATTNKKVTSWQVHPPTDTTSVDIQGYQGHYKASIPRCSFKVAVATKSITKLAFPGAQLKRPMETLLQAVG